ATGLSDWLGGIVCLGAYAAAGGRRGARAARPRRRAARRAADARVARGAPWGARGGLAGAPPVGHRHRVKRRGDRALVLDGKPPALPLDSFFALNPAMPNLHRLYKSGAATIVHATATSYRGRSHFDGQDVLESGLAKPGAADTGWLNRALASLQPGDRAGGSRARFAIGPIAPLVVRGPAPVLSWTPRRLPPTSDDTVMRLM